jgi:hypothetical protein
MEEAMRRIVLATAATLAILVVGSFVPNRAEAMTVTTPVGLVAALDGTNLAQDVAYVCRRLWRCGPYGCGWRRACWWTGGGPYYYGYGGSYPYYGRPYRRYGW